jgi:hypothetical protein
LFFFLFHFLVVDRRQIFERGVQPESVVEGLDGVEDGGARLARVRSSRRRRRSLVSEAKKLSATALS